MHPKRFRDVDCSRRRLLVRVVAGAAAALIFGALAMTGAAAPGGGGGKSKRDTLRPTITASIAQQSAGSVVLSGTTSDNIGVTEVDVAVDGGPFAVAQGTATWSYTIDTSHLAAGAHTATAKARDAVGNSSAASVSFSVSAPTVSFVAPTVNATVGGTITVNGTASAGNQLTKVELAVDSGAYSLAQGTASWSGTLNTSGYANGPHTLHARATDAAGNVGVSSEAISVSNDFVAPTVTVTAPSPGATVSGTLSVTGTASDDVSVANVKVSIDGGTYAAAQGTTSWTYSVDTTQLANGSHTLTVQATDASGKTSATSVAVTVSNTTTSPNPQQLITPEGVTIVVAPDVTDWTPQQIYDLLKPNAYQLSLIGPHLTIEVQTQYASSTVTGVSGTAANGYYNYHATIDLDARPDRVFSSRPDKVLAHEYGHAWTLYHLYMTQRGSWAAYLAARGIANDPRLDSTYNWSKDEMIADDYRLLFGTQQAQDGAAYINPDVPDPRTVPGLKNWFINTWAAP